MTSVAVICALNPSFNSGMLTVDLAAGDYFRRHFNKQDLKIDYFNSERRSSYGSRRLGVAFNCYPLPPPDKLSKYDAIVFWGDFTLSRRYYFTDVLERVRNRAPDGTPEQHIEKLQTHINAVLLTALPESVLQKVVCFGGSLYINSPQDDLHVEYRSAIKRIYQNAKLVLKRDPLSAQIAHYYAGRSASPLGVDAAFLLHPEEVFRVIPRFQAPPKKKPQIGVSFGRNLSKNRATADLMRKFAERIGTRMNCYDIIDLKWLAHDEEDIVHSVGAKIADMRECAAIITDTYHCAVNAWRDGIPTICIGQGAEVPSGTLSEKKKELLYMMFNARAFYAFVENIQARCDDLKFIEYYANLLRDAEQHEAVKSAITMSVTTAEGRLTAALMDLLGAGGSCCCPRNAGQGQVVDVARMNWRGERTPLKTPPTQL